jgi:hypothetical protein
MDNPTTPKWDPVDLNEIIKISIDNVLVDWIGHPGHGLSPEVVLVKCNKLGLEARQLKVGTREVWRNEIENNGYVVDYHDGKGNSANVVTDSNAVHYTLQEYGTKHGAKYSSNPKYRSETDNILVSAFDTFKNKRVIVDGIHRGAVMSSKYSSESDYSKRIVYEWYGNKVNEIFTYDFSPFYRDNTRTSIS